MLTFDHNCIICKVSTEGTALVRPTKKVSGFWSPRVSRENRAYVGILNCLFLFAMK